MENNQNLEITTPQIKSITKTCKCCGKTLPLGAFTKKGMGYRNVCKDCENIEDGASDRFKDVTARELIEELRKRGYTGTLKLVRIDEVKL